MSGRIDIHSHFVSERMLQEIRRRGDRCGTPVEVRDGRLLVITPERPYGPIGPGFYDMSLRTAFLEAQGIEKQVLLPPPFTFYYWSTAADAYRLMEAQNDSAAEAVRAAPDRFLGFATVMLQDVPASIRECERIRALGMHGIELGSNINGTSLHERQFWPFYAAVESLGLAILIHPNNVAGGERMGEYHLRNLVGFPFDTTLTAAQFIFSGLLDRFPRLRLCLGQAGGFLPFIIGRLDAGFHARPECRQHIDRPPSTYLRHFYFDTIIHSTLASDFLIRAVGADRIMLGSDFPFDMKAATPVADIEAQTDLTEEQRQRIYHGTAAEFLCLAG